MKLASIRVGETLQTVVQVGDVLVELDALVAGDEALNHLAGASVLDLISTASPADRAGLAAAAETAAAELGTPAAEADFAPPIAEPSKVLCIGLNYVEHIEETGAHEHRTDADPVVFTKYRTSLIGHGDPVVLPPAAPNAIDWEGELAVVIGRECSAVSEADALDVIGGYTVMNDLSARDLQMRSSQWTMGKAFDGSGPCGPAVVTADEIDDPQDLHVETIVNGEVMQSSSTSLMIYPVRTIIAFISSLITLEPGDIIATGTPAGIGASRDPMIFLRDGDTVTVRVSGVGELVNPVRSA